MKNQPLVSVLMPVYNAEKHVALALKSILSQSYSKLELILVDDGSSDSTPNILKSIQQTDPRIKIITNRKNVGVTKSLNLGLAKCRGKYIARMDADDWSYRDRIASQVALMEENGATVVCGAHISVCDKSLKKSHVRNYHLKDGDIRKRLFRYSPFAHPVTVWRADFLKKAKYNPKITVGQDYELYFRAGLTGEFRNVDKVLLKLRMHEKSVSNKMSDEQSFATLAIRKKAVQKYGYKMSIFDQLYNFAQRCGIYVVPIGYRFKLFNLFRRIKYF